MAKYCGGMMKIEGAFKIIKDFEADSLSF